MPGRGFVGLQLTDALPGLPERFSFAGKEYVFLARGAPHEVPDARAFGCVPTDAAGRRGVADFHVAGRRRR